MTSRLGMCGAALLGFMATAIALHADEEKIAPEKLPAAVRKAVKKKFPEAKVRGAAKEVAEGKTTYEVEMTVEGRAVDAIMSPDGKILELEKEIAVSRLPEAVKKTLAAKYPGAKIEKAEALTKGEDGPTNYEVIVGGKEVLLNAKGRIVDPKEQAEDDEKPTAKSRKKQQKEDKDDDDDEGREGKAKKRGDD